MGQWSFRRNRVNAKRNQIVDSDRFVAVIVVSVLMGVNIGISRSVHGGGEFFVVWQGARGLLLDLVARVVNFFENLPNFLRNSTASAISQPGIANPYTVLVANQTQQLVYGRAA